MATMDVFEADAFSMISMSSAIMKEDFLPTRLSQLNLFQPNPIRTESVQIDEESNVLSLIQTSERGAPPPQSGKTRRLSRNFNTVRIAKSDTIRASEIQNIRETGTESELQQVMREVAKRQRKLLNDMALTHENMRLGAVQGIVTDADDSEIINWYTELGVSQPTEIDFDLDNASPASGAFMQKCNATTRAMRRACKGSWIQGRTRVHALCGDTFWDQMRALEEVRETFKYTPQAQELRDGQVFETFNYGGITWENYQGTDDNSTVAIGATKAKFFPVGANNFFEVAWSPGESIHMSNMEGQPVYSMLVPDPTARQMYVDVDVYSYPLFICKYPLALQSGKNT